jgi:hypothetical protein
VLVGSRGEKPPECPNQPPQATPGGGASLANLRPAVQSAADQYRARPRY